jgi:hypothetical protein
MADMTALANLVINQTREKIARILMNVKTGHRATTVRLAQMWTGATNANVMMDTVGMATLARILTNVWVRNAIHILPVQTQTVDILVHVMPVSLTKMEVPNSTQMFAKMWMSVRLVLRVRKIQTVLIPRVHIPATAMMDISKRARFVIMWTNAPTGQIIVIQMPHALIPMAASNAHAMTDFQVLMALVVPMLTSVLTIHVLQTDFVQIRLVDTNAAAMTVITAMELTVKTTMNASWELIVVTKMPSATTLMARTNARAVMAMKGTGNSALMLMSVCSR